MATRNGHIATPPPPLPTVGTNGPEMGMDEPRSDPSLSRAPRNPKWALLDPGRTLVVWALEDPKWAIAYPTTGPVRIASGASSVLQWSQRIPIRCSS
ncbi:hypothetical protein SEA_PAULODIABOLI_139 [Microbacterium phage PauloDiaboli]|nr:hypothetical protein SEA_PAULODIABOLI_139 [Microbacterium phage PauloDiaboli]